MDVAINNALGKYLRERRATLDAASLGFACARRRTPGLRREEVAQRASISATWYTWLEQGRGGAPSEPVLERIAQALVLTAGEREHVFLLALGRLPSVRYQNVNAISPRLQRVLDAFGCSPAFIKSLTWDLVAWNRAAAAVFGYDGAGPDERNVLRRIFSESHSRQCNPDWNSVARFCVAAFRADVARAGPSAEIEMLVESLCALNLPPCGATAMCAATATAPSTCAIRKPVLLPWSFHRSRSMAGPTSGWWSTVPRPRLMPTRCGACSHKRS
jgi:transcriptional regulator with XRE-family HTH domain